MNVHLDPASELRLTQSLSRFARTPTGVRDTAAGIHDAVLKILAASQEVIIVSTRAHEPVDAYAMLKVLHLREPDKLSHGDQQRPEPGGSHRPRPAPGRCTFLGRTWK